MDEHQIWHRRMLMEKAASALGKNGFGTNLFDSSQEAADYLVQAAEGAETIGFGGSMTVAGLGLAAMLEDAGKTTLVHGRPGLSGEERREIMQQQLCCDLFLTSTNALTLDGHLVNIDATGNRAGAMFFGPKKTVVVAGVNKIVSDIPCALRRIREVACPPNARRLGFNTPCAKTGLCSDCNSPDRICRITTIIERKPRASDLEVCLINEELGY